MTPRERAEALAEGIGDFFGWRGGEALITAIDQSITAALAEQAAEHERKLKAAVEAEREACAKLAADHGWRLASEPCDIAKAIRARGKA